MEGSGKSRDELNNLIKGYNMLLYFTGSMIMYEPKDECVIDFMSDGILKTLPVSSSNPLFLKAAGQLRETCNDRERCKKDLINDYHRLFSNRGKGLAIALRSAYPKMITDESRQEEVSVFYKTYGWNPSAKNVFPDDHLGIELLFLTKLTDMYLQLDDEPCIREMGNELHRFISNYLSDWVHEWNKKVQLYSVSSQYRGIGNMIEACVEDLYSLFGQRERLL
ncbi:MAG TPA: molecular chaperone TorD family protein [Bacteroidales bacterium]|nr:molecular chaperone TorD family protein [Bacteroidales bacterium]HPF02693.1 molecular chaperone TorD family protein [Bacteroidales bacterium]HPJ58490.1 molecular chaperone TorD family protein [Bacteroidales bacterium]HPR11665.1 molecular chaperone TorD family protein [Bacteroidales bacterium]HRW85025.1 molecular chaperone TorD family protein [Bacteroidales bacterium]